MRQVNLVFCLAAALLALQGPTNLNFQENGAGGTPKNWFADRGYSTATSDDCRRPKSRCAVLRYEGRSDPQDFGGVSQTFDATALRGEQVRFKAWLRVKHPLEGRAQHFVRVDRSNGEIGFHDYSHDCPVRSRNWTMREIAGRIDTDAVNITIGLLLGGRGAAYIADLEFVSLENPR